MRSPLSLHNENVAPTESPMGVKLYPFPPPTPTDADDADDADEPPPPPPPATVINETTSDPVEVQPGPSPTKHGLLPHCMSVFWCAGETRRAADPLQRAPSLAAHLGRQ